MNNINTLLDKIENKTANLAVIGLGYVGLPVAGLFAKAGFNVTGVEIRKDRLEQINRGKNPIEGNEPDLSDLIMDVVESGKLRATDNYKDLSDADVILIDVETPVDAQNIPQYEALRGALTSLGAIIQDGVLVCVESTIAPGTMRDLVLPLLTDLSGKKLNKGFYLGNCPERVMPGKLLRNLRTVGRVVGGMTPDTANILVALYRQIVEAALDPTDCLTAELVKTTENAYRDVQIAFANEAALICEAVGGDVWKVRDLVNKSPGRQMHLPGSGVGGHCIPKDPWLLAHSVRNKDVPLRLIPAARMINDSMPMHMVNLLRKSMEKAGRLLKGARIAVLGYAYLEDSDDIRNSPSEAFVQLLRNAGAIPVIHDPWVAEYKGDLLDRIKGCEAAVVMVAHSAYLEIDLEKITTVLISPIVVDGRKVFKSESGASSLVTIGKGTNSTETSTVSQIDSDGMG